MVFSDEDKILIKKLYFEGIHWKESDRFPEKSWAKYGVNKLLLKKLRDTGTVDRRPGSGRPRSVALKKTLRQLIIFVLSQEDKPQTHTTVCEISRKVGIRPSSVSQIICKGLHLKCFNRRRAQELTNANCAARMKRAKLLLQKFPQSTTDFVFFKPWFRVKTKLF